MSVRHLAAGAGLGAVATVVALIIAAWAAYAAAVRSIPHTDF